MIDDEIKVDVTVMLHKPGEWPDPPEGASLWERYSMRAQQRCCDRLMAVTILTDDQMNETDKLIAMKAIATHEARSVADGFGIGPLSMISVEVFALGMGNYDTRILIDPDLGEVMKER